MAQQTPTPQQVQTLPPEQLQTLLQQSLKSIAQWKPLPQQATQLPPQYLNLLSKLVDTLRTQGLAGPGATTTQRMAAMRKQLLSWGLLQKGSSPTADQIINQYPEQVRRSVLANEATQVRQDNAQQMTGAQTAVRLARRGVTLA